MANPLLIQNQETMCNIEKSQKVKQNFEVDSVKYQLNEKHVDDLSLHDTSVHSKNHDTLQCKLDLMKVKQLQGQDTHLSKIIVKCKSQCHHDKTPYYLDEYGIAYRKVWDGQDIFHAIIIPKNLQSYILYKRYNALGHNGSTRL